MFSTRALLVRSQLRPRDICGSRSGYGVGFLRVFELPLAIIIPQTAPHSLLLLSWTLQSLDTDSLVRLST
jgi:hypothetical protein